MNRLYQLPVEMQHDFYLHATRRKKRYGKWGRVEKNDVIEALSLLHDYNRKRAEEAAEILTPEQREDILRSVRRGGKEKG